MPVLTVKSIHCNNTEDALGADECKLEVYTDHKLRSRHRKKLNDGQTWFFNRQYTYKNGALIKLWDEDSHIFGDKDDFLGSVPITAESGPQSATLRKANSQYSITYHVERAIEKVGVWCGSSTLNNPERDVDFAVANNINRLDIVVNDHSAARKERRFYVRDNKKIERLCKRAQDNGIDTHLMSWIMPHRKYIDRASELLVPLCNDVGAKSLQWDAEEPWTQARKPMRYKDAALRIRDKFSGLSCQMGYNAIGYASVSKVGPLAEVSDYAVPQAYSTARSGVKPGSGQKKIFKRWMDNFDKPIIMGLAAFRQKGIPGHTIESAIKECADASQELGCTTVIYWDLAAIRSSSTVRKAIAGIL